jgi:ParB/RepB/Spo0J family partition protein
MPSETAHTTLESAPDLRVLDIAEIVPHPDNPRSDLGDTSDLKASITELGVLQPLIVVPMDAVIAANPGIADRLQVGNWVALDGHRRLKAATDAGTTHAPVIVRDDLAPIGKALRFMITVAVNHNDWSAMDEARAFGRLRDEEKLSERQIAKETGVSRGQVHKRLSLLRLPAPIAADLESGKLSVTGALDLLKLPDDQIEKAWTDSEKSSWRSLSEVVEEQLKDNTGTAAVDTLLKRLADLGITTVESAADVLGANYYQHKLDVDDPDKIPNPADVIARVWRSGDVANANYFTRTLPMITGDGDTAPYDDSDGYDDDDEPGASAGSTVATESSEQRQARLEAMRELATAAVTAREEACQRLVNELPDAVALEILADSTIAGEESQTWETTLTAMSWCGAPFDPDQSQDEDEVNSWLQQQAEAGGATAARIAVALALAGGEDAVSDPVRRNWNLERDWTTWQIRHVQRLIDHAGHEPNSYEQERLSSTTGGSGE